MKKCASCTKDLPDAALHCVFCGAKQPPTPSVQPAKTAFGYSANEVYNNAPPRMPPVAPPMPVAPTMPAPPVRPGPPSPLATPPAMPPTYPGPGPQGGFVPQSAANAKTMFAGPGPGPMPNYAPPSAMAQTLVPPAPQPLAVPAQPAIPPPRPSAPLPAQQPPPYLASQTASRVIRPVEPWRDGLRAWMFLWGLGLVAAFVTPVSTSPLAFLWREILEGQGTARLPPLMIAAVGLLSIVLAVIPMPVAPRGFIATLLGLAGIGVPIALHGVPPWEVLAPIAGMVVLVPSLLVRDEYRDSLVARLLVTASAIAVLLPFVVPKHDTIPLVASFKQLIDLPGAQKAEPAIVLGLVTIVVMSLLAWLPAPATGAAKVWAWLLILFALFVHATGIALRGGISEAITGEPNYTLVSWIAGNGPKLGSAYLAIIGYGLASVIGKQLE